jgi:hypothetical protein
MWADPPRQKVVPWTPRLEQTAEKVYPPMDAAQPANEALSFGDYLYKKPIAGREDEWARALSENLHHLMGWRPDFCALVDAKEASGDSWLKAMDTDSLQLLHSWVRRIHGGMKGKELKHLEANFLRKQADKMGPLRTIDQIKLTKDQLQSFCMQVQGMDGYKAEEMSEIDFAMLLKDKLWHRVDWDHDGLILDEAEARDRGRPRHKAEWEETHSFQEGIISKTPERDLMLSKKRAASLILSVRKADVKGAEKKTPLLVDLKAEGQEALIEFAKSVALPIHAACLKENKKADCQPLEKVREDLLGMLHVPEKSPKKSESYDSTQKIEVQVSSALNSSDVMSRVDYIATYLYVYPYPLPANPPVSLADEFWDAFRSRHAGRPPHEQNVSRTLAADLDAAWYDIRVRIENVQTTVTATQPQDIAKITKEAVSSAELNKLTPSAEYAGVKGSLAVEGAVGSHIKTTVEEKLLKQLEQRSVWINSARDLLRITQRGTDAINVGGAIREEVTLKIPQSATPIFLLDIDNHRLRLGEDIGQPMYSRVHALAVNLAVVREPYKFKRLSTERFGLPDDADAYLVVQVSNPIYLDLWDWERTLDALTLDDLLVDPRILSGSPGTTRLMYYSPALNLRGDIRVAARDGEKFRKLLKAGIMDLTDPAKRSECSRPDMPSDRFCIAAVADGNNRERFYLVANSGESGASKPSVEHIWLGKRANENTVAARRTGYFQSFDCDDIPYLQTYLAASICSDKSRVSGPNTPEASSAHETEAHVGQR